MNHCTLQNAFNKEASFPVQFTTTCPPVCILKCTESYVSVILASKLVPWQQLPHCDKTTACLPGKMTINNHTDYSSYWQFGCISVSLCKAVQLLFLSCTCPNAVAEVHSGPAITMYNSILSYLWTPGHSGTLPASISRPS